MPTQLVFSRPSVPAAAVALIAMALSSCAQKKMASDSAMEAAEAPASLAPGEAAEEASADEADGEGEPMAKSAERESSGKKKDSKGGAKEETTWKRSQIVANASRIKVGDHRDLPIRGIEARVQIDGFRARVLLDYYFENPDAQQYEGSFTVRLPTGASPYFLAFGQSNFTVGEIKAKSGFTAGTADEFEPEEVMTRRAAHWIEPKEARIVPKERAAFAFQETVRQRVDPALMEWAGPGMFNAKLFPIAPNKLHRVVIGYDANLTPIGNDYEFTLPLPTDGDSRQVHVAVTKAKGMGVKVSPEASADDSPTTQYFTYTNPAKNEITVRLKDLAAAQLNGQDEIGPYFAGQFVPALPDTKTGKPAPRDALFLVDTSLSANPDRFNVWLKLMRAVLDQNRPTLARFGVTFFNIESFDFKRGWLENTPENVAALEAYAGTLALEGATDIGQVLEHVSKSDLLTERPADIFLMSDGAVTWGDADPYALTQRFAKSHHAVFAYRTGMSGDDVNMLDHFARETGGAVFSVVGESEVATAATAHTTPPWTIHAIRAEGATDVLLAGRPKTLFAGQRLTVVGRGAPKGGFTLVVSRGGEKQEVKIAAPVSIASSLTSRVYGQIAVGQLEEFLGSTRPFAEAYARQYRVPGASSSLLMLESEADYQRFGIVAKDDAEVVRTHLAYDRVMTALDELILKLGDPKAAFLAWLEHASTLPGVMLQPSDAVARIAQALPKSAFVVTQSSLAAKRHDRASISPAIAEQLAIQKPEYDAVSAEAERRKQAFGPADALKALSSLVEANPGDTVLARDVGYSAALWGFPRQAFHLFRRVAEARPYEPQTFHAMANTLAASGMPDLALLYYEVALSGQWDSRFGEFRRIVELDYLGFLRKTAPDKFNPSARGYAASRRADLARSVDVSDADIVVVISWNTDRTDVDLHVIEPGGEECYYSHPQTKMGGSLTRDVTTGYGPEMYVLKKAKSGKFQVRAKYYASDSNRAGTRTKVDATVYQNWGRPNETATHKVVTLEYGKEMHDILTFKR